MRAGDGPDAIEDSFDIDDYTRWRLLEGLDDIGITLGHDADIAAYEQTPSELEARNHQGLIPLLALGILAFAQNRRLQRFWRVSSVVRRRKKNARFLGVVIVTSARNA